MPASVVAPERLYMQPDESRLFTMDFTDLLEDSETLTGTPTVAEESGNGDLGAAVSVVAVNTSTVTRPDGTTIAVGEAVQFRLGTAAKVTAGDYRVSVKCATTASNTLEVDGLLYVRD
jgi:hypothetical protein